MEEDRKDLEIESMLKGVRLKEPSRKEMADFLSGVHVKIDQGYGRQAIGFRQIGLVLVAGLALAGLFYFMFTHLQAEPVPQVKVPPRVEIPSPTGVAQNPLTEKALPPQSLSVDQEIAVLEAFEEEFGNETADVFGDSEVLEELATLDELEFSIGAVPRQV